MCKMRVSEQTNLEFIIYNLVISEITGKITTDSIYQQLQNNKISIDKNKLNGLFSKWTDDGLLFDNYNEYIVNDMMI